VSQQSGGMNLGENWKVVHVFHSATELHQGIDEVSPLTFMYYQSGQANED
jgi:hypothetical protein